MVTTSASARVGSTLAGKYHVDRVIGEGGMAVVYAATHRNGQPVAVKVLDPGLARNQECRERFLREGYVANQIDHPGAIRVLDHAIADDGSPFLVMELLEGETLHDLFERLRRPLDARLVAELGSSVLDVLAAAHAASVVHRDVKPANIFLKRDGTVKLLDFGVARLRDPRARVPFTKAGQLLGTPAFMAPEQLGGRVDEIDGRTDLWAVGATMFMLLTGESVHPATGLADILVAGRTRPARSLRAVAPYLPDGITRVVDGALAFDKKDRWRTARQMRAALDAAITAAYRLRRTDIDPFCKTQAMPAVTVMGPILSRHTKGT